MLISSLIYDFLLCYTEKITEVKKMKDKLGKKIYEVTIKLYDSGKVCTTQKGNDILVSRPVSNPSILSVQR